MGFIALLKPDNNFTGFNRNPTEGVFLSFFIYILLLCYYTCLSLQQFSSNESNRPYQAGKRHADFV